jgi:hypothetical protein
LGARQDARAGTCWAPALSRARTACCRATLVPMQLAGGGWHLDQEQPTSMGSSHCCDQHTWKWATCSPGPGHSIDTVIARRKP